MRDIVFVKATFTVVIYDRRWQIREKPLTFVGKIPYAAYKASQMEGGIGFEARAALRALAKKVIERDFREQFHGHDLRDVNLKVDVEEEDDVILSRDSNSGNQLAFIVEPKYEQLSLGQEYTTPKEIKVALKLLWEATH